MAGYPKIKTVYKRDPDNNYKTLIEEAYAREEFAYLANNEWVFTEKADGTNIRAIFTGPGMDYRGRTEQAQIYPGLLDALRGWER